MQCPACTHVDLLMSDRQGIEIDYCPKCRGVWLDRGELDKLIEKAAAPAATPERYRDDYRTPPPQQGYRSDSYYGKHHKKRKGLLGELFDFD